MTEELRWVPPDSPGSSNGDSTGTDSGRGDLDRSGPGRGELNRLVATLDPGERTAVTGSGEPSGRRSRTVWYGAWVAVAVVGLALGLSPFDRETVAVWAMAGLVISAAGRPAGEARAVVTSWLPFLGALLAYDLARTLADDLGRPVVVEPQLAVERLLFLGAVPADALQRSLHLPAPLAAFGDVVYLSHFVAPVLTAAWLWTRDQRAFRVFAGSLVLLSFLAAACFVLQPTAPPWFASDQGLIEVERTVGTGLRDLGLGSVPDVLDRGREDSNPFAAIPSLHTGYAVLVAAALTTGRSTRFRAAAWAYPAMMVFVLVHGGEHYVLDGLLAVPLALGARRLVMRVVP